MKNIYAVILAGGAGIRFWPLSQKDRPKQFLKLFGKNSLFIETLKRAKKIIPLDNIYISSSESLLRPLKKELGSFNFQGRNILLEPKVKNTAPAIGYAALKIYKKNPNAVMVVLPSDHLIKNTNHFYRDLKYAIKIAEKDKLVVFGVKPKREETGYGYIRVIRPKVDNHYQVHSFIEKPDVERARKLVKSGNCYWNSGMFVWNVKTILREINIYNPSLFKLLTCIKDKNNLNRLWPNITAVSIDVSVLEKTENVVMVPASFDWSDLGSWLSWSQFLKKDKSGNYFSGNCKDFASTNIDVLNYDKDIVTLGLKDIIIVNTKDGLLVCNKDNTQDIKKIIE